MVGALLMKDIGPTITYENVKSLFREFKVVFISIIGQDCAYIILNTREDASRALDKINGTTQFGRLMKLELIPYMMSQS